MSVRWSVLVQPLDEPWPWLAEEPDAVLRTADKPEGPWTSGELVIPSADPYTGYAPYIHPWSKGSTLYFTYSVSVGYQVYLMRLPLRRD